MLRDQVAELAQQRAALRSRSSFGHGPGRERRVRRAHRAIDVLGVAARDQRPRLAGVGVVGFEVLAGRRVDPFAADVGLIFDGFHESDR